jgi:uncharacterized protein (TIGR02145 family)
MKSFAPPGYRPYFHHFYKQVNILPALISVAFLLVSCGNSLQRKDNTSEATFTEIQIGSQVWMAKNFDGVLFGNGDSIPHAKSAEEWEKAGKDGKPAWCYYQNDPGFGRKYGRIYNWYAVNDSRGFGPGGWHVPTNEDWIILEEFLGTPVAGFKLKCKGEPGSKGIGNDSIQFCAMPGGYRGKEGGFAGIEEFTYLSSSTGRDRKLNDIWGRGIHFSDSTIMRSGLYKEHGLYVRLIKNK